MTSASPSRATGGGGDDGNDKDSGRVYRAVAAGESAEEVRRIIDQCARVDEQRRAAAVNWGIGEETPLRAAHRQRRGDLVGALVEAGASVGGIFQGRLTPIAVCIAYGRVDSVRALLRNGHDPSEKIKWDPTYGFAGNGVIFCLPAHLCLAPALLDPSQQRVTRQVGCLEVLVDEGGVDVNAQDRCGETPLFWLAKHWLAKHCPADDAADAASEEAAARLLLAAGARASSGLFNSDGCSPLMATAFYDNARFARFLIEEAGAPVDERSPPNGRTALYLCGIGGETETMAVPLEAGADIEARYDHGGTPLRSCAGYCRSGPTQLLLDRGASADVVDSKGLTPLIWACEQHPWFSDDQRWPVFQNLLPPLLCPDAARRQRSH